MEIIELITREMRKKRMSPTELARQLNLNPTTVAGMLKRNTLQVNRLYELSKIFEYNFFKEIADTLSLPEPAIKEDSSPLKDRIKELEIENGILRKMLKI